MDESRKRVIGAGRRFWRVSTCRRRMICSEVRKEAHERTNSSPQAFIGLRKSWRRSMRSSDGRLRNRTAGWYRNADSVAEILSKWGGRAIAFGTWAHEVIKNLRR